MKKREGFSLIVVLILSIVCVALAGAMLQLVTTNAGTGRSASGAVSKYNMLQGAIENGRAELASLMDNTNPVPRHYTGTPPTSLASVDDLLIKNASGTEIGTVISDDISARELTSYGLDGGSGELFVKIYDMNYDPSPGKEDVSSLSPDDLALLPPSLTLSGTSVYQNAYSLAPEKTDPSAGASASNAGAYLIRATLEVDGKSAAIYDTAVIQANKN